MEVSDNDKSSESFLKIDTIWSEAEESFQVKEEIVSDFEPECPSTDESSDCEIEKNKNEESLNAKELRKTNNLNGATNGFGDKNLENKCDAPGNIKLSCIHDAKNYKIVRRKLHCGDCKSLVCPECYKVLGTTFQTHLAGCDLNKIEFYSCKACRLAFHSFCAFQAHVRIHTMTSPYVCPDCGLIYNNINFLILHLIKKCCHVYKCIRYKCKCCPEAFFSPKMFVEHIQIQHIESRYRCSYCSSLFGNPEEFRLHMNKVHQNLKAKYISYFLCSLCSNMIISRFMYEKHITQHCESYDSYKIDYQCVCKQLYSTVGALQAHLQQCSKKEVLPYQWTFLHKKLTSQQLSQIRSVKIIDEISVPQAQSSFIPFEPQFKPLNLFEEKCDFLDLVTQDTTCKKLLLYNKSTNKGVNEGKEVESGEKLQESELENVIFDAQPRLSLSNSPKSMFVDGLEKEFLKSDSFDKNLNENDGEVVAEVKKTSDANTRTKDNCKNSELYNHIPCDHLGYLSKTQTLGLTSKSSSASDTNTNDFEPENKTCPAKFKIISELDEKTGLIITKKVPFDESLENETDKNDYSSLDCDKSFHCSIESKTDNTLKNSKPSFQYFFTCPFCIVKFQKHKATFQQFRLHLESYHPDSALNIVFNTDEEKEDDDDDDEKSEENVCLLPLKKTVHGSLQSTKIQTKLKDCYVVLGEKIASPFSKSNLPTNFVSKIQKPKDFSEKEKKTLCFSRSNSRSSDNNDNDALKKDNESPTQVKEDENEKMNFINASEKTSRDSTGSRNNVCWTVQISVPKSKTDVSGIAGNTKPSDNEEKGGDFDCYLENEVESTKPFLNCQKMLEPNKSNAFEKKLLMEEVLKVPYKQTKDSEINTNQSESVKDSNQNENIEFLNKPEKTEANISILETKHKKLIKIEVDLEDDIETSKNLSWSSETLKGNDSKTEEKEEKEKTRRESEVWSEFYESLKSAEKLKKKKAKTLEEDLQEGKNSVVSDYSAKRIVKKPKRFRQSSESECSGVGCENSDSDRDNLISNYLVTKKLSENEEVCKTSSADVNQKKKQTILNKLENIDDKMLDYLFHIINKKEKYMELRNKNSSLSSFSYNQDLQTYRKKVLNGIKQRGRPHKVLRCEEMAKKKSQVPLGGVSILKELPDRQKICLSDVKSSERKRGRPRKVIDPSKVKERRRSNKEVDFIEKNFERDEAEASPSKRKRKLSSKLQYYKNVSAIDEKDDFSSGQVIANKPFEATKKFCCAFCKEIFIDILEFREHILGHRVEENSYQCMECGECFVVRPSLEKHLHAFHKIKNTDKYISENQCCNAKEETADGDNEPLKENQCKVCKDQFDRAIDLTKHFRIHGMAFLKQFRKEGKSK